MYIVHMNILQTAESNKFYEFACSKKHQGTTHSGHKSGRSWCQKFKQSDASSILRSQDAKLRIIVKWIHHCI